MKIVILAVAAAFLADPSAAQEPPGPVMLVEDIVALPGATLAPDCGNLHNMAGRAFCVSGALAGIGELAEAYSADLQTKGWLAAGGDNNRVVFVRRRDGGGCDGLQMQAFYDTSRPPAPASLGYLGFATIPGDVCAAQPPAAAAAPSAQ